MAYLITPYTTKKSHSHGGFLRRSQGHRQFSSAVTRSLSVFGRSQIVIPVAALSTAHIGVTTPCLMLYDAVHVYKARETTFIVSHQPFPKFAAGGCCIFSASCRNPAYSFVNKWTKEMACSSGAVIQEITEHPSMVTTHDNHLINITITCVSK